MIDRLIPQQKQAIKSQSLTRTLSQMWYILEFRKTLLET